MKLDHHDFRISMNMFELTPDYITEFATWLEANGEDPKKFLSKEIGFKREMHTRFSNQKVQEEIGPE